jgi:3-phosphoshikimate 1-carboxyvinyltransferase
MRSLTLAPLSGAAGTVALPGSKSISNRALLLAALASGETTLRGVLDADDTRVMRAALAQLGVRCEPLGGADWRLQGAAGTFPQKRAELALGNAGTAFRPLAAVLAFCDGEYLLSGVPRMHERPIGDLVDALNAAGARVEYLTKPGYPPLAVRPGRLRAPLSTSVRGDVSSQYLSALLMALPLAGGGSIAVEGELISKPYVEITLKLMARFGVEVASEGWRSFRVPAGPYRSPGVLEVEGDASSASYFLAAGAIGGGPVRVEGVGRASIQGDVGFSEFLEQAGAQVSCGDNWIEVRSAPGRRLRSFDTDFNLIPDAAMTAAALALFADGPCAVRNVASWRVKETDRIAAMATELRKLGASVEEGADYLRITPPASGRPNAGIAVDTYDDHRIAMCFSLVALAGVPVTINDPDCVAKTFPDYFERFASIALRAA